MFFIKVSPSSLATSSLHPSTFISLVQYSITFSKYDTEDYFSIDNSFGSKEDMINLVEVAHENNIRVVLDGVFNHCSEKIRIKNNRGKVIHLVDEIKKCGKETPYYYWFEWEANEKWRGFANLLHIPILNTSNEDCVAYLLNVIEYWTKLINVDG